MEGIKMKKLIFAAVIAFMSMNAMAVQCYKFGDIGPNRPVYTFEGNTCPLGYTKR